MKRRVRIVWTKTAKDGLSKLPRKVRRGLLDKADELADCDDPRKAHKPLTGPLRGHYRITYGRYRAIYNVTEEELVSGDVLVNLTICFIAAGIRKERDRNDVYKLAQKLVDMGLAAIDGDEQASDEDD